MSERGDFTITRRVLPVSAIAISVGALSAVSALLLLRLIAFFTNLFFFGRLSAAPASPADHALGPLVILVPIAGAVIVGLMARYGSERIRGHGIPEAMEAILLRGSRVEPRVAVLKPISAAISIGSGGPFGAEGPIIMTGGAVGSIVAQTLHLTAAERKTLLVAGAAGGMAAVFATPVAAVLLGIELLLFEWKPRSAIPVALASGTAAAIRPFLLGDGPLFPVPAQAVHMDGATFAACLACGLAAGLLSAGVTRAIYAVEDGFARLPVHWMWWPAIGAVVVGVGGWLEPRALGVGYDNIAGLLDGSLVGGAIVGLMLAKGGMWIASLGTGTSGGVLAPLLTLGAALGALEVGIFPAEGAGFWPLVSMGAALAGTMRAPLTAVVFAIELTRDFDAMLPLLLAVTAAYLVTSLSLPRSILTEKIARRGFHVSSELALDPLEILFVSEVMQPEPVTVQAYARVCDVADLDPDQRLVPVVEAGRFVGVVTQGDLAAADPARRVGELVREPVTARADDVLREVAYRMAETGRTCLPVVDPADARRLVGLVRLDHLLRGRVRALVEERRRERPLALPWPRAKSA